MLLAILAGMSRANAGSVAALSNLPNNLTSGGSELTDIDWKIYLFTTPSSATTEVASIEYVLNCYTCSQANPSYPSSTAIQFSIYSVNGGIPNTQIYSTNYLSQSLTAPKTKLTIGIPNWRLAANTQYALIAKSTAAGKLKWANVRSNGDTGDNIAVAAYNGFSINGALATGDAGSTYISTAANNNALSLQIYFLSVPSVTNSPKGYTGSPISAVVSCLGGGASSNILYNGSSTVPSSAGTYSITADCAANDSYSAVTGASAGTFTILSPPSPSANAPQLAPSGAQTTPGMAVSGTLSPSAPAGTLFYLVTPPTRGTATIATDGTYTYTPSSGFEGLDSIGYVGCSGGACGYTSSAACTGSICSPGALYVGVGQGTTTTSKEATVSGVQQNVTNVTSGISWNGQPASDPQFMKQIYVISNLATSTQGTTVTAGENQNPVSVNTQTGEISVAPRAVPATYTVKTLLCLSLKAQSSLEKLKKLLPIDAAFADASTDVNLHGPMPCVNQTTYVLVDSTLIAQDETLSTWINMNLTGSVATNDTYPVGAAFSLVSNVQHGKLRFFENGLFRYNPKDNFRGVDAFSYSLCEPAPKSSLCSIASVTLNVGTVKLTQKPLVLSAGRTSTTENRPVRLYEKGGSTHSEAVFTAVSSKGANCRITGSGSTRLLRILGTSGMYCTATATKRGNKVYEPIASNAVTVTLQ